MDQKGLVMALAATAYAEYRQVDETWPQLPEQATVADSFKDQDVKRGVRYRSTDQPSATVLVGYLDPDSPSLVVCGQFQDSIRDHTQSAAGNSELLVGSGHEVGDAFPGGVPEREKDLVVRMPAKYVRDCTVKIVARVKAVPNPILHMRQG